MSVSKIDKNRDWNFGRGLANYITGSEEIAQNVATRLRSFVNDWFLDTEQNIDWFVLLGTRGTEKQIKIEVERVARETQGVLRVLDVQIITDATTRESNITIAYVDVYQESAEITTGINI